MLQFTKFNRLVVAGIAAAAIAPSAALARVPNDPAPHRRRRTTGRPTRSPRPRRARPPRTCAARPGGPDVKPGRPRGRSTRSRS